MLLLYHSAQAMIASYR